MAKSFSATPDRLPPRNDQGIMGWVRTRLFFSPLSSILTLLTLWVLAFSVPALIDYFFVRPDFAATTGAQCQAMGGYCWAFVREKHRLILFGIYPYDEQWRPLLASVILIGAIVCSCIRWFWRPFLAVLWVVTLVAVGVLMWGGVFGLSYVENAKWGGLPVTLILSTFVKHLENHECQ